MASVPRIHGPGRPRFPARAMDWTHQYLPLPQHVIDSWATVKLDCIAMVHALKEEQLESANEAAPAIPPG
jgi:hypothetical protein